VKYREPPIVSREALVEKVQGGDAKEISGALIGLALNELELPWIQDRVIELLDHSDARVRASAIISVGHLVRLHGSIDEERVLPILERLNEDPEASDYVENALDDIQMFLHRPGE
jgi:hypothetical protein